MELENLLYGVEEGIAQITLNRPKAMNALSPALVEELDMLLDKVAIDGEVQALIITGNEKAFAAGADITALLKAGPAQALEYSKLFHRVFDKLESLAKPVVAAVSGLALGGGCELALSCDLRIAAKGCKFGQPEINLGIIPGAGGTQRLSRLIGSGRAKALIYTGDMVDAEEGYRIGLVNRVVEVEELSSEARALARKLANKPGLALAAAKRSINQGLSADLATGNMLERECFAALFATEDQKEGMQAFVDKRKATFRSR